MSFPEVRDKAWASMAVMSSGAGDGAFWSAGGWSVVVGSVSVVVVVPRLAMEPGGAACFAFHCFQVRQFLQSKGCQRIPSL